MQNRLDSLPRDLVGRAEALFMATLQYSVDMMTWEHCDILPSDLQPDGDLDDLYVTILFNDEIHTFDQVSNSLFILIIGKSFFVYPL